MPRGLKIGREVGTMGAMFYGLLVIVLLLAIPGLFLAFPIYVLSELARLRRDVQALKQRLAGPDVSAEVALATDLRSNLSSAAPAPGGQPASQPAPEANRPPTFASAIPVHNVPAPAPAPLPVAQAASPGSVPTPVVTLRDVERVLGANWLAKLGVAAIAVAVAFFLQYVFKNGLVGPSAQVGIGLFTAAVLLAAGQSMQKRPAYRQYAQVLASGGIVTFFLSIYAAYSFYSHPLIGYGTAFTALVVGALAASVLAMANDAEMVAVLCILGAFAAPVLIREQGGSPPSPDRLVRLYAYIALVNLWAAGLVRFRAWHVLALVAAVATWLLFFGAGALNAMGWQTEGFAALFLAFACYAGLHVLTTRSKETDGQTPGRVRESVVVGLGIILGACMVFSLASIYLVAGSGAPGLPDVTVPGICVALLLAALAAGLPPLESYDRVVRHWLGYFAAAMFAVVLWISIGRAASPPPNQIPIAFAFMLFQYVLFLATAIALHRRPGQEGPATALSVANAAVHALMAAHVLGTSSLWGIPAIALWLPLAGVIALGGLWLTILQRREARLLPFTLGVTAQALALYGLMQAQSLHAVWPHEIGVACVSAEFLLLSLAWLALRHRIAFPVGRLDLPAAFGNAAIFFGYLSTALGRGRIHGIAPLAIAAVAMAAYHAAIGGIVLRRDDLLHRLVYLGLAITFVTIAIPLQLTASYITLAWAVEAVILVWTGIAAREHRFQAYGLLLLALAAGKATLVDLPIHFVSLEPFALFLNTRMLAGVSVIAAIYAVAWLFWQERARSGDTESPFTGNRFPQLIAALLIGGNALTLLFVSIDLWEWAGTRWAGSGQQLALSIYWAVYALATIVVGIHRRIRPVRLFAMGLLYLSILKVFLYDLSGLEPLYRIISFFTLGVILLVTSLLYTRFEAALNAEERADSVQGVAEQGHTA